MNIILLSGGSGKRLWPLSNDIRSKQFIKIFRTPDGNYESMVQRVYRQILSVDPDATVTIATSKSQISALHNQLGEQIDISVEPCRRDTFPAIALAAAYLHDEKGVQEEIDRLLEVNSNLRRPTRENPYVSYPFVYHLMYVNRNPDYFSDGLPSQTGQQVMKNAVQNMKAFYKAKADWRKHPKKYSGEPKLPGYKKSGGQSTYCFTNQQVRICGDEIRFPCTDITAKKPKNVKDEWTLKQVNVVPNRNVISLQYVFEDHQRYKEKKEPNRIVSIDLGIKNFAAMTNNIDQPGILFKGGWLRHINYWYNQKMSSARSSQTEGTTKPFHSPPDQDLFL